MFRLFVGWAIILKKKDSMKQFGHTSLMSLIIYFHIDRKIKNNAFFIKSNEGCFVLLSGSIVVHQKLVKLNKIARAISFENNKNNSSVSFKRTSTGIWWCFCGYLGHYLQNACLCLFVFGNCVWVRLLNHCFKLREISKMS